MKSLKEQRIHFEERGSEASPALFLDRDGVIIEDKHYLREPKQVELIAGAKEILEFYKKRGWSLVIVTNQSGIERGFFDWSDYEKVTNKMLELLEKGAWPTSIYANSHGPNAPATSWRKPSPGMIQAAAEELNLNLEKSILIGDRLSDMKAGASAGVKTLVHVGTGHGEKERAQVIEWKQENGEKGTNRPGGNNLLLLRSIKYLPMDLAVFQK